MALLLLLVPPAWAQRGRGGGGGRPGGGDRGGQRLPQSEWPRVEGYPLQLNEVVEVVERGEGRQALAVYQRTASAAAQAGDRLLEARAQSATAFVAFRLGMLQKTILAGRRALELYRGETLSGHDVAATATVYAHVGNSYRNAGDPDVSVDGRRRGDVM